MEQRDQTNGRRMPTRQMWCWSCVFGPTWTREQFMKHLHELVDTMSKETAFVNTVIHDDIEQPRTSCYTRRGRTQAGKPGCRGAATAIRADYERLAAQLLESRHVDWLIPIRSTNHGS